MHVAEQARGGYDGNSKSKDERYYYYLMEEIKTNYKNVATFKDFESSAEISRLIEDPEKVTGNNGGEYPSQKWHFYVSYIAYREAASKVEALKGVVTPLRNFKNKFDYYSSHVKCPELMLWLAETALGSECPKVQSAYEIARTSRKNGINGKDTCDKIREIIPWTCIEEKIKEKTRIDQK